MSSILYVVTHATDNTFKAVNPFEMASVAADSEHEVAIALLGDGVLLLNDSIAGNIQGVGTVPFKEALAEVVKRNIPIFACGGCMKSRGVEDACLEGKNARHMNKSTFVELTVTHDRVINY